MKTQFNIGNNNKQDSDDDTTTQVQITFGEAVIFVLACGILGIAFGMVIGIFFQ